MLNEDLITNILSVNEIEALKKFLENYISDSNVVGILLSGSHVHGDANKYADMDIHIVLKESETRERGNLLIENVEIEYFINPIVQIENYFEIEYPQKINTAHMFVYSIVLYESGSYLQELIEKAKNYLKKPIPHYTPFNLYTG